MRCNRVFSFVLLLLLTVPSLGLSQTGDGGPFPPLQWRNIGPDRGGRSIAVAGHRDRPFEYYFGATGGGLFKTTDGGASWFPVTDGQIRSSSVGAVAVAESNPDVVYIGMGEVQFRGNVLQGDGVYRSVNGGVTWNHLGLAETQTISRIRIDPRDPDRVFVAALGHAFGPNEERGVFRTTDGGQSWEKVLYENGQTGAADLVMDPNNSQVLYASLWEVYRKPWKLWSGGEGSGLYKSVDGGESWIELSGNPGFPAGVFGKITVTVSGADSQRVWANVEAEEGGLYMSDDGGESWALINNHRDIWQRAFYFLRIEADPVDRNTLYIMNFRLMKSTDAGRTLRTIPETHADHQDLWIDPDNPLRMINGNDGGGVVTVNGGKNWTSMMYPTAQIYRLGTTVDWPYHACGAQQDNSTICVSSEQGHLQNPRGVSTQWMYGVGGGENGYVAPHPTNPDIFYSGATNTLSRYDRGTGLSYDIQPYPRIVMGEPASAMPERWNWNYPIVISRTDPDVLYVGSQHLWRTEDEGETWARISPDLTRAEPATMEDSGGPIVFDQDGPEIYATVYSIAPSPHDGETIWTGSDDGLVHITRNGGTDWQDVTPPDMPAHTRVVIIEASPHRPGSAYVAGIRYEMDDRTPYAWRTSDYGESWTKIISGIRSDDFVRVVREDPDREGLLYAGTEHGVYISFDNGSDWRSLSFNLPDVPVTGLEVKERDLVISTHGRSFWVLDDMETLRQMEGEFVTQAPHLFQPADAYRRSVPAIIDYYVGEPGKQLRIEILDAHGQHVRTLFEGTRGEGIHRQRWNLRYEGAVSFPGIVLEGGNPTVGPWAPPGRYQARLTVDGEEELRPFEVLRDPRLTDVTDADLVAQFELASAIRDQESEANGSVLLIRDLRGQIEASLGETNNSGIRAAAQSFMDGISTIEGQLYQVRNQSPKDKIAFPIKLNDRLTGLRNRLERGDVSPSEAYRRTFDELSAQLMVQLELLEQALRENLPRLNEQLKQAGLSTVVVRDIPNHAPRGR